MNVSAKVATDGGEILQDPVTFGVEPYLSEVYARAERHGLWSKVWQVACREEEIPRVGDYVTYDILDDSILIVRSGERRISAYHNVCMHRGRRLMDGCGHATRLTCRFHGWSWSCDGENVHVLDKADWGDALKPERLRLREVQADVWGGWIWINMDPRCKPLREYLEPAATMLDPFELDKMRFRWRQWVYVDCN